MHELLIRVVEFNNIRAMLQYRLRTCDVAAAFLSFSQNSRCNFMSLFFIVGTARHRMFWYITTNAVDELIRVHSSLAIWMNEIGFKCTNDDCRMNNKCLKRTKPTSELIWKCSFRWLIKWWYERINRTKCLNDKSHESIRWQLGSRDKCRWVHIKADIHEVMARARDNIRPI